MVQVNSSPNGEGTPSSSSNGSLTDIGMLRIIHFSNEPPNDDLETLLRRLTALSKDKKHHVLARFLDEATNVVQEEVGQLTMELKMAIPAFDTVISFAGNTELRKGRLQPSIDGVLHCLLHLGTYIAHRETTAVERSGNDETVLTGLGLGLLSAAVVSLAPSFEELPTIAAEAVRIAFKLGVHVTAISQDLEVTTEENSLDSWAYVVSGCGSEEAQRELDSIQSAEPPPETARIFISAVSATSVTISGPPSRLKWLFRTSGFFRDRTHFALPVYGGLCHASHIYTHDDAQQVISSAKADERFYPVCPVIATSTGKPFSGKTATALLQQVVFEILTQQIAWDNVVKGIVDMANADLTYHFHLSMFRKSLPTNDLCSSLESNIQNATIDKQDFIGWLVTEDEGERLPRTSAQSKLAIVGMSCRLPGGATDNEKFWQILEQGLDVSREIPADRFDIASHYDSTGKELNKSGTQYGCFIDEPGMFDAPFFNMSPKESQTVDPQMRLALVTAYEALEQSGFVANRTPSTKLERIGTFYGQAADDYREVNQGQEVSTYYIPGGCRAFGPGRINYFFKFSGPSYSIDTACSSGLAAVEVACQALWSGTADTVVTGGLNVLTNPDGFAGLCSGHFLTRGHNACKTWDATADGYCRADGVVSFVIKRFEDAVADNDRILATILGAATNHSAEAVSITHPHAGHQAYLARKVLREAKVDPFDVSYIELHGTGTQAGDFEEMSGVMDVYAPITKRRSKNQPLHIGSVKANVGHGESVAGATSLLKVLMMLEKNAIPQHIGIKTEINPRFPKDFDKRNLHIPFENTPWVSAVDSKRVAVVNSFGAAGGNTTMVLEEAPARAPQAADPRPSHVIAVSAKCKASLKTNLERMLEYLNSNPDISLADLSYSTTARRHHHNHRIAVATTNMKHLKQQLEAKLADVESTKPAPITEPLSVAMVFTGQGASDKSMNLDLYHHSPVFREEIQRLDTLARRQGYDSFTPAIDGSYEKDYQHSAVTTQLSLVCIEIALAKYWEALGIKPEVVLGHSLGEYAALHVAGVLSANDAIFLTGSRAALLEKRCQAGTHKMMSVEASVEDIKGNDNGMPYEIACINGPSKTVLAGPATEMEALSEPLQAKGYRCITLPTAFAFHSEQTAPILDDYQAMAKSGVVFQAPRLPVISPLLGKVVFDDKSLNASYVTRATRESVNFLGAVKNASDMSIVDKNTAWIEIGPHPVCLSFLKACLPYVPPVSGPSLRRGEDNFTTMAQSLRDLHIAGVQISWNEYHRPFESDLRMLKLPTYAWNEKNYWLQYKGDWALTKGNSFYTTQAAPTAKQTTMKTTTVHDIVEKTSEGTSGKIVMQSDLMQPDFLAAAHGHSMNGCGVVTSSIHADIAYTLGEYLHKLIMPKEKVPAMNIANLEVTKGLVANAKTDQPQLIRVSIATEDITAGAADMEWYNVDEADNVQEPFATANVFFSDTNDWTTSWSPMTHLIKGRIDDLNRLAQDGTATCFSRSMAYTLFANNLVNYADKYRGMRSVVMNGFEAFANVRLTTEKGGTWTVPPYFIDSVAHLAGFVMNCSDASDVTGTYCVTPGWRTMRFAKPLTAGSDYQSYVKMIPTTEDPTVYFGDVYILQDGEIVGMVGGIQFRRYPRILLKKFFSPPDSAEGKSNPAGKSSSTSETSTAAKGTTSAPPKATNVAPSKKSHWQFQAGPDKAQKPQSQTQNVEPDSTQAEPEAPAPKEEAPKEDTAPDVKTEQPAADDNSVSAKALDLIASEVGVDRSELSDDTSFANIGVDSLMSLVLAEKFRDGLGIESSSSLFLEYPTIGDLTAWLVEYHS